MLWQALYAEHWKILFFSEKPIKIFKSFQFLFKNDTETWRIIKLKHLSKCVSRQCAFHRSDPPGWEKKRMSNFVYMFSPSKAALISDLKALFPHILLNARFISLRLSPLCKLFGNSWVCHWAYLRLNATGIVLTR